MPRPRWACPSERIRVGGSWSNRGGRAAQLPAIARRAATALCALMFGLADYSADLGLPSIANKHLVADWAEPRSWTSLAPSASPRSTP